MPCSCCSSLRQLPLHHAQEGPGCKCFAVQQTLDRADRSWFESEVFDGYEFVIRVKQSMNEHGADKCGNVEPFAIGTPSQQAMIEISSVDVCYCLHRLTVKKKRSQTLRPKTSLRVGRTVRLDMNPLTSSVGSVPHRRTWRKGVSKKR